MSTARNAVAITAHDTNAISPIPDALYVGTGGTLILRARGSSADVTFANVPDGSWLLVQAQYVRSTGTTAADIVGVNM